MQYRAALIQTVIKLYCLSLSIIDSVYPTHIIRILGVITNVSTQFAS